jgi:hypothetical protein
MRIKDILYTTERNDYQIIEYLYLALSTKKDVI